MTQLQAYLIAISIQVGGTPSMNIFTLVYTQIGINFNSTIDSTHTYAERNQACYVGLTISQRLRSNGCKDGETRQCLSVRFP